VEPSKRQPLSALAASLVAFALLLALLPGDALARHLECGERVTADVRLDADLRDCGGVGLAIGAGGVTVDLGGHQLPAEFALSLHALEAFVHGWDLATALDQPFEPAPELVEAAWESARMIVSDDNRSTEPGSPYGPAVTIADAASPLDALIAFTGRSR